jgi:APA family basic amino acid/polyamine antiporter
VEILQEGETAMGSVAQAFIPVTVDLFGVSVTVGEALIVLGAVFSMVSASNASILAASGIGSLMGRQGHAPRPLARIHKRYGTPFWSVVAVTGTIVAMIVAFIMLLGEHGVAGHLLGLERLTGFATFNLLVPLAIVNIALIYSRRNLPDITRGFRVPGVPVVPALGVVANLALISQLPFWGMVVGVGVVLTLLVAYLAWGGAPEIDELYEQVREPTPVEPTGTAGAADGEAPSAETVPGERFRILVPIARPRRAERYVRLAGLVGRVRSDAPLVQVVTVTEIPDQTPYELAADTARKRADRIETHLDGADLDIEYAVEGHTCRDVAFDIVQTARTDEADLILMGYPEEHPEVAEAVEYRTPCDVLYNSGFTEDPESTMDVLNVGVGGGPHHEALLPLADALGSEGREVHLISVEPSEGPTDKSEDPADTLSAFENTETVQVHNVRAATIAEGLVSTARENGGVLLIGVSRDRRLRRWVFGSTPDRVIDLASSEDGVAVVVYASTSGVTQHIEDYLFPVYKYVRRIGRTPDTTRDEDAVES